MNIFVAIPAGVARDTFLTEANVRYLESLGNVTWNQLGRNCTPEELAEALVDVDVCVGGWGLCKFDEKILAKANRLKLIAYVAGSVNYFVTDEMYARGIRVVCGNDAFAESVAEGTVAYMMTALRKLPQTVRNFDEQGWPTGAYVRNESLLDQTVGIIGLGAISRYLIGMLKPFRAKIKIFSGHTSDEEAAALGVQKASLEEIFTTCKIVSVHWARTPQNYHRINDSLMSLLKPDSILINTARGDIIDEAALAKHLQAGHFRAVLDVYEEEPLPADSPLRHLENAILIPHRGGPTTDRRHYAALLVLEDIERLQKGEALQNEISPARAAMMTH